MHRTFPLLVLSLLATTACEPPKNGTQPPASSTPTPEPQVSEPASSVQKPAASAVVDPRPTLAPSSKAERASLAQSSNGFAFDLYHRVKKTPGNLVVSPASITTALAMTWGGARAETRAQMKKVLHFEGTQEDVMLASGKLSAELTDPTRPITFRIANRLFGEKSYTFEQKYLDQTKVAFGAPLEPLDFKGAPEPARRHINAWVEERTEKRIKELLPERAIDGQARLVLVNAIYFLGDWEDPFNSALTKPAPFSISKTETKDVPTMKRAELYRHFDSADLSALEIPYKGGELSMVLVLPKAVDGLSKLEASLDQAALQKITAGLKAERVMVSLPKFEIAPASSLSLAETLKDMGMPIAFDRDKADFTGIANPTSPADRLYIGNVFHKAFIKVDEKGTEAAAATAVVMARAGGPPQKPAEFKADHPFLFFIVDRASGLVLFMGRLADPSVK